MTEQRQTQGAIGGETVPPDLTQAVPLRFVQTVLDAEQLQASLGLGAGSTIRPVRTDLYRLLDEAEAAHITTERISVGGREVQFSDTGWVQIGEPVPDGQYELKDVLGRGGMGMVCVAWQHSLKREVALKIAVKAAVDEMGTTVEELEQFTNEAYIQASLDHPNVVPVHTMARDQHDRLFFTMQQVKGVSWECLLDPARVPDDKLRCQVQERAARMTLDDHLEILLKVADAVAYAHSKQVVHRDLKPENVMIGSYGEVRVMDWGLAMCFGERNPYLLDPGKKPELVGTPAYFAPEMARGEVAQIGPATDVYLLGGILYRILTGYPPHFGSSILAAVSKAALGEVEPAEKVAPAGRVTPEMSRMVHKALATCIEKRYATVQELQEDLRRYRTHAESLAVTDGAARMLAEIRGQVTGGDPDDPEPRRIGKEEASLAYGQLNECIGAFRQATRLWAGNRTAREGLLGALTLQIRLAMDQGDLTMARFHIDNLRELADLTGDDGWAVRVGSRAQELSTLLDKLLARKEKARRRHRIQRYLLAALALLVLLGIAGAFLLLDRQKRLALANLRATEARHRMARKILALSQQMHHRAFAQAVAGQAALIDLYLRDVEQLVNRYRLEAARLMTLPERELPVCRRTPAGRDGFYLDEDFYDPRTRPPDMQTLGGYSYEVSPTQATIKLAPWAARGEKRERALRDARRLARLSTLFSSIHGARSDVLWSVAASRSGVHVGFPGSGRFGEKPEYDPTRRPWYRAAIGATDEQPRWASPHIDAGGQGLIMGCSSPVRAGGLSLGVVGIEVPVAAIGRMMLDFTRDAGARARGLLVRKDHRVVVDTRYTADPQKWSQRFELASVFDLGTGLADYYRQVRAGRADPRSGVELAEGGRFLLAAHARLAHEGWLVIVVTDSQTR